jgi:hypothetical protein
MDKKKFRSRKLTNELCWKMRAQAANVKYAKEAQALKKTEAKLADELYKIRYEKYLTVMESLPKGAFSHDPSITVYGTDNERYSLIMSKPRITFYNCNLDTMRLVSKAVTKKLQAFEKKRRDLRTKMQKYEMEAYQLLRQAGTTKVLFELMPEAVKWLPEVTECTDIPIADTVAQLRKL